MAKLSSTRLTKKATYGEAIVWIAFNDETANRTDPTLVEGSISALLVADLFDVDPRRVAQDVIEVRAQEDANEAAQNADSVGFQDFAPQYR